MGKRYKQMSQNDIEFLKEQKLFYMASCSDAEVNLSPKGYDSIRVIDEKTVVFANYPGSSNRTYRDAKNDGEFTIYFNAFDGAPKILRLFCKANIVDTENEKYEEYLGLFDMEESTIRDIFEFHIYAVESSCGMSVPIMEYKKDRDELKDWAMDMAAKDKLEAYKEKNFTPPNLKELKE